MKIKIKFKTRQIRIDDDPSNLIHGTSSANSTNFTSFSNANFPGFQRDEIYRFGIVFFDSKMKPSFVNFIGDIKIPDVETISIMRNDTTANSIYCEFEVEDLPEEVQAYQIVYVPRTMENRTVIDMGYCQGMTNTGFPSYYERFKNLFIGWQHMEFVSPEILYNKLDTTGEFIEQVYLWDRKANRNINSGRDYFEVVKGGDSGVGLPLGKRRQRISETEKFNYTSDTIREFTFGGLSFKSGILRKPTIQSGALPYGVRSTCQLIKGGWFTSWGKTNDSMADDSNNRLGVVGRRRKGIVNGEPISLYGNVESNVFIPCSALTKESKVNVWGDTYINFFEFNRVMFDPSGGSNNNRYAEVISLPVETSINTCFKANPTINSLIPLGLTGTLSQFPYRFMQEIKGAHGSGSNLYMQDFDLYTYNSVYSRQNDTRQYIVRPATLREDNKIDTRIYHSDRKINAELEDGWLIMRSFLDLDSKFGGLTKLHEFKNNLYYFQPRGYGVLSIDQRELTQTELGTSLTLGQGGILDRYDYLSTTSGTALYDSIISSKLGIYYLDGDNKAICRVGETPEFLSDMSIKSWVKPLRFDLGKSGYNPNFNLMLFTIDDKHTLVYNENLQKFTEFYTFNPDNFIQGNSALLTVKDNSIYNQIVSKKGEFDETLHSSKLSMVINPEGRNIQRLDVIELLTNVFNQEEEELFETVSTIRVRNSYQDTGEIEINNSVAVRRFRNWRINMLRDSKDEGRLKDTYFILDVTFNNTENKLIRLDDVIVNHFPIRPY